MPASAESPRLRAEWRDAGATWLVEEPDDAALRAAAPLLSRWYNEPKNRALLTNQHELSAEEVVAHYADLRAAGDRPFLFLRDGALAGDGDLRAFSDGKRGPEAEFALLIGDLGIQGRGLGTRFSTLVLHLAFGRLGLARVFASVIPANRGSLRMFEKLGFVVDETPAGRRYAEHEHDVSLRLDRESFAQVAEVKVTG